MDAKEAYLSIWKRALPELLGCTKVQAEEWIKTNRLPWDEYRHYRHEPPVFWVIDALISPKVIEKIGAAETAKLKRDILHAIEQGNLKWYSESYDWSAARQRIRVVFRGYGVPDGYSGSAI